MDAPNSIDAWYRILFDADDYVCWGNTPYSIATQHVNGRFDFGEAHQFVSINPFVSGTTRKDANVSKFRNILLEFDKGSLDEQLEIIKKLPFPISAITFSGGKSYHVIISLSDPIADKTLYDQVVKRLYSIVPDADPSGKNCSRFTRAPGAYRGAVEQKLIHINGRVNTSLFLSMLPELKTEQHSLPKSNNRKILKGTTWAFIYQGASKGLWNRSLFLAALDIFRSGYSYEDGIDMLSQPTGNLDKHDISTIKSAYKTFTSEQS